MRAPVRSTMRPATASASARSARPDSSRITREPERSAAVASSIAASPGSVAGGGAKSSAVCGRAGVQAVSAGRIRVAMRPGSVLATRTASAASPAMSSAEVQVRTQDDMVVAMPSMSPVSGESVALWPWRCSPTMLTSGTCARLALCRLARPLPRPGARCSRVEAGLSAMRA